MVRIWSCFCEKLKTKVSCRRTFYDIESYERLFFERLSNLPGVQEINSTVALSEIKSTTSLPIRA